MGANEQICSRTHYRQGARDYATKSDLISMLQYITSVSKQSEAPNIDLAYAQCNYDYRFFLIMMWYKRFVLYWEVLCKRLQDKAVCSAESKAKFIVCLEESLLTL